MIAAETPKFVWYLMRSSGFVALGLFTLTVALGVIGATRLQSPRWPRLVTGGLHRNLALTATCFLAIHIGTALIDSWVGLGWLDALVPFRSAYRPLWVGLGVVSFDLFLAILVSSLLRARVGARLWRLIHWGTWLMWPLALVHALGSGTDAAKGWGLGICVACIAVVVIAGAWRIRWALFPQATARPAPSARIPGPVRQPVGVAAGERRDAPGNRSVVRL